MTHLHDQHDFDYVVVCAGSAGCALAHRLSESGKHTVAVLESGGKDDYPWIHIPVGYFKTMGNPRTDWSYPIEDDPGLNNRSITWLRGKGLGGSSSINGLLYVRGQALDFDHWRQLGNTGWQFTDVLPYFRKAESWEGEANDLRGGDGPLNVSHTRFTHPIIYAWLDAAVTAGYFRNDDYNGAEQEGVGYYQMTTRGGRRCSTAVPYLRSARQRKTLRMATNTQATQLAFDGLRISGVVGRGPRGEHLFRARREVIISSGAIASPQLLLVSGIGPESELRKHGIEVRHALEGVGQNLQDHLQARPVFRCTARTINDEVGQWWQKFGVVLRYAANRTGPMAIAASLGAAFLKTRPELESPDIQFHIQPFSKDNLIPIPILSRHLLRRCASCARKVSVSSSFAPVTCVITQRSMRIISPRARTATPSWKACA